MNRPSCCWMIGWYAERPCRSCEPTSTISFASGTLPGASWAATCAPPQSSSIEMHTRYSLTLPNHRGILTPPVLQQSCAYCGGAGGKAPRGRMRQRYTLAFVLLSRLKFLSWNLLLTSTQGQNWRSMTPAEHNSGRGVGSMAREPGVEIFSIGTELVMGRIQDTNAFWMAQELVGLGALVRRITVLPDDLDTIVEALAGAVQRQTDVVLTSGGLGPTPDDLTVHALAALVGVQAAVHEPT